QLWIHEGFAHGFVVISDTAEFVYKTNNYYSQQAERSIIFDDKDLGIAWPLNTHYILSEKDLNAPTFKKISSNEYFK
ncbi:dTDP-4-dehydrorhamnose 3,5-epimerase, partial [Escherichia coli]